MGKVLANADRCTVWVVSDDGTEIWTRVAQGIDTIRIAKSSGIVGTCITSGQRLIVDDVYQDPRFNKDIHIFGRITAIADVFDALGSDRVYKKAWDDEKIFQLLSDERESHFDPKLIDLFFSKLDAIKEVRETFKDIYIKKPDLTRDKQITILGAYGTKAKGHGTTAIYLNRKMYG